MNEKNTHEEMILSTLENFRQEFTDLRKDFSELRKDVITLSTDVSWIKGKLEGRAETRHVLLTGLSIVVAIAAVVVAIFK